MYPFSIFADQESISKRRIGRIGAERRKICSYISLTQYELDLSDEDGLNQRKIARLDRFFLKAKTGPVEDT